MANPELGEYESRNRFGIHDVSKVVTPEGDLYQDECYALLISRAEKKAKVMRLCAALHFARDRLARSGDADYVLVEIGSLEFVRDECLPAYGNSFDVEVFERRAFNPADLAKTKAAGGPEIIMTEHGEMLFPPEAVDYLDEHAPTWRTPALTTEADKPVVEKVCKALTEFMRALHATETAI